MIVLNEYIAAIDGGATKTDMVLCTLDGRVLNRVIGGSTNPNDIGFEKSVESLRSMLEKLLENHGGLKVHLYSFYAGLSGGGGGNYIERYKMAFREMLVNTTNIYNGSDAINALNSGIGCNDGMVLIAGTGSVAFVRKDGKITHVGGWGYLLDDAGSGYDIGRRGFRAALRDYDGRGESTIIFDLYSQRLAGPVYKFIPEIYQRGKQFIASFAPLVFEAATKGDKVANTILDECAAELALLVKAGARHLKESEGLYKVVLAGGLWKAGDALINRFKSNLSKDFLLIKPELPPVYGAVIEAISRANKEYITSHNFSDDSIPHDECNVSRKSKEKEKYLKIEVDRSFYENFKNSLNNAAIIHFPEK